MLVVLDRASRAAPRCAAGPAAAVDRADRGAGSRRELPDLAESWLWAHAQAVSRDAASRDAAASGQRRCKAVSRAQYLAARLPAPARAAQGLRRLRRARDSTAAGCAASASRWRGDTLSAAWTHARPTASNCRSTYHWEFSTGPVGDIETLARRLSTPQQYARRCGADRAAAAHRRADRRRRRRSSPVRRRDPGPAPCSKARWSRSTSSRAAPNDTFASKLEDDAQQRSGA